MEISNNDDCVIVVNKQIIVQFKSVISDTSNIFAKVKEQSSKGNFKQWSV